MTTQPIRLAFLMGRLTVGGAELQMLALGEQLIREGFAVDYVSRLGPGVLDDRARGFGANVRHIGAASTQQTRLSRRAERWLTRTAGWVTTARRQRYDIVDAWLHPADSVAALTRPLTRTPVVLSARLGRSPRISMGPATGVLEAVVGRLTDAVVANADITAADAHENEGVPKGKIRVIRGGVILPPSFSRAERAEQRAALGAGEDDLIIGCVGNFRTMKRHDLLIEAFARLAPGHSHLRLVLVGDGDLRPRIEARVAALGLGQRVVIYGHALDVRPLYDAFDLFVQASNSEGLPNVILEAAATGLPIVATAAGGTGEVVRDNDTGLLVPVDDLDRLVRALEAAVEDADLRRRLGLRARKLIEDEYGMDRFVREYGDLYRELLGRRQGVR